MSPYTTFWDYDSGRDGQIASGATVTSPWFDATGISHILVRTSFTGGTTAIFVDYNREGPEGQTTGVALITSSDQKANADGGTAGAVVATPSQFVRIRIVQTVAITTNAQLMAKGLAQ